MTTDLVLTSDPERAATALQSYIESFDEDPGYLDFGRVGPIGTTVIEEQNAATEMLARARHGSFDELFRQDARVREAVGALTRFPAEQIVFQPNTSTGLMHAMFGLTGGVLLSAAEFPSVTFPAVRAAQALGVVEPLWLQTEHGRVTPAEIRAQLTSKAVAVAVSLVDSRTGYLADLDGIRQVIGDRLLIVDAIQGFGVVDAPYEVADIVVSGGQKWCRAGWGTGFMALSERAIERLTPVFSGFTGSAVAEPWDAVGDPVRAASAYSVSNPDPIAQARFAGALEEIADVGVPMINTAMAQRVSEIIDVADEFGISVVSSRDESERAGIVVVQPEPEELTPLTASLLNHGVTARIRPTTVRLSAHASTSDDTIAALRAALTSAASGVAY
ncbi:aminotransferase class V-fold PLP-dependent enzyme [Microbacteriaceae bacterium VKM Ac-2855]|nr:aminotransferase class V-fold PLP-dependent enzyme [Microbacteriaceae bacterium VKM Ac-2855]